MEPEGGDDVPQQLTAAQKKAQTVAKRKATIEAKKKAKEAAAAAEAAAAQALEGPAAMQLVRSFMKEQATVNEAILGQLKELKDKCGRNSLGSIVGESNDKHKSRGAGKPKQVIHVPSDPDIVSECVDSDIDSDIEGRIKSELAEAHAMLQPKFTKIQGRARSVKQIEDTINQNRPFAFLEREKQRDLARLSVHPEELDILSHLEGLATMASNMTKDDLTKGILNHIHQIIKESPSMA